MANEEKLKLTKELMDLGLSELNEEATREDYIGKPEYNESVSKIKELVFKKTGVSETDYDYYISTGIGDIKTILDIDETKEKRKSDGIKLARETKEFRKRLDVFNQVYDKEELDERAKEIITGIDRYSWIETPQREKYKKEAIKKMVEEFKEKKNDEADDKHMAEVVQDIYKSEGVSSLREYVKKVKKEKEESKTIFG